MYTNYGKVGRIEPFNFSISCINNFFQLEGIRDEI